MTLDPSVGTVDPTRPFGVYVHVPFCAVRCPYCDFAVDDRSDIPHERYADALVREIRTCGPWFAARPENLRSIYFGGGTPSLLRADCTRRVIESVQEIFGVADRDRLEITLEANPDDVRGELLAGLRAAGVNRLSIGVQSFDDGQLQTLGRNHDGVTAGAAVRTARAAGFERISCDLMLGLPGQTPGSWRRTLEEMLALAPDHLSCYALTIEKATRFGALDRAGTLHRPDDDAVAGLYETTQQLLADAGFEQYEVSSYARTGRRAIHNSLYWTQGAYLGVGCSASSFRPLADGTGFRFTNPRATDTYLRAVATGSGNPERPLCEHRTQPELENEALWLGLRTRDGVDREAHAARFGVDPLAAADRQKAASASVAAGWLEVSPAVVRPTARGFLFADELARRLWL